MMKAKIITFDTMMNACNTIHEKIYMFNWSISNAKKYGQAECIKTSVVDAICNHSKNVRASKKSLAELPIPPLPIDILPAGMTQKVVRLDQIMVGIMHTLFLNLGKHILSMVKSALRNKKWSEFYHQSNTLLSNIQSLSLNWCKCYSYGSQEIPGSLWVSDNYLGFSLVLKHIFSLLMHENDDVINSILKTIWSYNSLVSVIMQCTECNELQCNKADSTAKFFLSQLNTMDNHIATINNNQTTSVSNHRSKRMKKDVNKIESTGCILNVLTIIKEMRTKGLQRNYWEGGLSGEGMFRHVKPFLKRGLGQPGIYKATLNKLYNYREIDSMIHHNNNNLHVQSEDDTFKETELFNKDRYRRFHCYRSHSTVIDSIVNGVALAACFYKIEKKIYCMYHEKKRKINLIEVKLSSWRMVFSTHVFDLEVGEVDDGLDISAVSNIPDDYISILILPIEFENNNDIKKYFIYSEEHYELTNQFEWLSPQIMNTTNNEDEIERIAIWDSKALCEEWINNKVIPLQGKYKGRIVAFKYLGNKKDKENAKWIVKYFKDDERTNSRAYRIHEYSYDEIISIMY